MKILKFILSFIGLLFILNLLIPFDGLFYTFENLVTSKPVIYERQNYSLILNNHPGKVFFNNQFNELINENTNSVYAKYENPGATFFTCGDSEPLLYTITSESVHTYFTQEEKTLTYSSPRIFESLFSNDLKLDSINKNLIEIDSDTYLIFDKDTLVLINFFKSCQNNYYLSEEAKKQLLNGMDIVQKNKDNVTYHDALKSFIQKRVNNEILTPNQCFGALKMNGLEGQKICQKYTDGIYDEGFSRISDAFYKKEITDEESCRKFASNLPLEQEDAVISEFDHKGTRSICASVSAW